MRLPEFRGIVAVDTEGYVVYAYARDLEAWDRLADSGDLVVLEKRPLRGGGARLSLARVSVDGAPLVVSQDLDICASESRETWAYDLATSSREAVVAAASLVSTWDPERGSLETLYDLSTLGDGGCSGDPGSRGAGSSVSVSESTAGWHTFTLPGELVSPVSRGSGL